MKKWVKWSVIGAGSLILCFLILWSVLLCFHYNIFAPKGWKDGCYLDNMGKPLTGWQTIDGKTYYFAQSGQKVTGWFQIGEQRYLFNENGNPRTGWYSDETGTYLLTPEGKVLTGWVETDQGIRYFDANGKMAIGLVEHSDNLWHFMADGTPCEGWFEDRYFDEGRAVTGWWTIEGEIYYFFRDGVAAQGWQNIDGARYLFDGGKAYTGWYTDHEDRYYFLADGRMAVGEVEIDGVTRFFTSTGKYVVLVNFQHAVPADYELNLVKVQGHLFDADAADDLVAMLNAARAAGHPVYINNAYRSVATQQYMFNKRLYSFMSDGMDEQTATSLITQSLMLPGHSEHHLGLAVDLTATDYSYKWLAENSWQYGFIVRYPEGKSDLTGVIYEPWHFRYVGVELAKELYDSGLCMEEYMEEISMSTMEGQ